MRILFAAILSSLSSCKTLASQRENVATSNFINRFAKPILQFGDSSGWYAKFVGASETDIDLKKAGYS